MTSLPEPPSPDTVFIAAGLVPGAKRLPLTNTPHPPPRAGPLAQLNIPLRRQHQAPPPERRSPEGPRDGIRLGWVTVAISGLGCAELRFPRIVPRFFRQWQHAKRSDNDRHPGPAVLGA